MKFRSSSTNYIKIRVTLYESELEFSISPYSTGKYLFDLVCNTLGLRETWYFGLQFYTYLPNGSIRLLQWVDLEKKINSQKHGSSSKPLCFFFRTKFFPEDVEQELIQATTRHLFYLSVKFTILNRKFSSVNKNAFDNRFFSVDIMLLLGSLSAQAEYGDLFEDEISENEESTCLLPRIFRLIPYHFWTQIQSDDKLQKKFRELYKSHKGMNRDRAELQYLKVAQIHNLFGVEFFPIVCVRMKYSRNYHQYFVGKQLSIWHNSYKQFTIAWLGVTAYGLQLYGKSQYEPPLHTFSWNLIKNISYRERKFLIKLTSCRETWKLSPHLGPGSVEIGCQTSPTQRAHSATRGNSRYNPMSSHQNNLYVNQIINSSGAGSGASVTSLSSTPVLLCKSSSTKNRFDSPSAKNYVQSADMTSTHDIYFNVRKQAEATSTISSISPKPMKPYHFPLILISVVEIWLADPNQAKTIMSLCAGNHSLFMRRRQPDSIEVQQMRAQAREERARREIERTKLLKARAEKAEAIEAKLALESKCAQLEQALKDYEFISHDQKCNHKTQTDCSRHTIANCHSCHQCNDLVCTNCKCAVNSMSPGSNIIYTRSGPNKMDNQIYDQNGKSLVCHFMRSSRVCNPRCICPSCANVCHNDRNFKPSHFTMSNVQLQSLHEHHDIINQCIPAGSASVPVTPFFGRCGLANKQPDTCLEYPCSESIGSITKLNRNLNFSSRPDVYPANNFAENERDMKPNIAESVFSLAPYNAKSLNALYVNSRDLDNHFINLAAHPVTEYVSERQIPSRSPSYSNLRNSQCYRNNRNSQCCSEANIYSDPTLCFRDTQANKSYLPAILSPVVMRRLQTYQRSQVCKEKQQIPCSHDHYQRPLEPCTSHLQLYTTDQSEGYHSEMIASHTDKEYSLHHANVAVPSHAYPSHILQNGDRGVTVPCNMAAGFQSGEMHEGLDKLEDTKTYLGNYRCEYLSSQLEAERKRFALLQSQFSHQLSNTWMFLEAARTQLPQALDTNINY